MDKRLILNINQAARCWSSTVEQNLKSIFFFSEIKSLFAHYGTSSQHFTLFTQRQLANRGYQVSKRASGIIVK